jgi:hypothetical protein
MKTLLRLVCASGLSAALLADEPAPEMKYAFLDPADPAVAELASSGERLIDRIGGSLMVETQRVIATAGLEAAVSQLHLKALNPPKPVEGKPSVTAIKRTSLRVRDPRNAPDKADLAALEIIRDDLNRGAQPAKLLVQKVEQPGAPAEFRVYRPISVAPNCLSCHGRTENLQPGVAAALERYYPEDRAHGYEAYDWRGVIRISYALPGKP